MSETSSVDYLFYRMGRAEIHAFVKNQIDSSLSLAILEKSRYRLDPESESAINKCFADLRRIVARSRLIERSGMAALPSAKVVQLHR